MNSLTHAGAETQDVLRNFAALYRLNVVGGYWDEGVSGTIPL